MTLILSCLTDDCVYQVSDRRLISYDPPRGPVDDETNKAVFVNGMVIFGYTGISKVNGENTDLWLTRVAASALSTDMHVVSSTIRDEATIAFKKMAFASRFKRHAFQGAGWFIDPERTSVRPGIVTIENALESNTRAWLNYARPNFDVVNTFPEIHGAMFHLSSVGYTPTAEERRAITSLFENAFTGRLDVKRVCCMRCYRP